MSESRAAIPSAWRHESARVVRNGKVSRWDELYYGWVRSGLIKELPLEQIAEARLIGRQVSGAVASLCAAGNDIKGAHLLMSALPAHAPFIIPSPWFRKLGELTNRTSALLDRHWNDVHRLANRLLGVGTMTGPEAERFILDRRISTAAAR